MTIWSCGPRNGTFGTVPGGRCRRVRRNGDPAHPRVSEDGLARRCDSFVDIAIGPVFAGFLRPHDSMADCGRVFAGVLVDGTVTTPRLAAGDTEPKMDPRTPHGQTLDASAFGHRINGNIAKLFTQLIAHLNSILRNRFGHSPPLDRTTPRMPLVVLQRGSLGK